MAIIRKKAQAPVPALIAEGIYDGIVGGTSLLTNVQTINGPKDKLKISFEIDCNGEKQKVSERYDADFFEGSKLHGVLDVFLVEVPDELDTDIIVGLECQVVIERRHLSDGKPWNGVKAVLPPKDTINNDTVVVTPASSIEVSEITSTTVAPALPRTIKTKRPPKAGIAAMLAQRSNTEDQSVTDIGHLFDDENLEGLEK